jgi:hypothetical protein
MPGKKFPSFLYATTQIVSTTLTVLILHNVESVYFFYSNPVFYAKTKPTETDMKTSYEGSDRSETSVRETEESTGYLRSNEK